MKLLILFLAVMCIVMYVMASPEDDFVLDADEEGTESLSDSVSLSLILLQGYLSDFDCFVLIGSLWI